jgi:hypothetical protein
VLVPVPALADLQLFRVEQRWHDFPAPPVTTPGGAGLYQGYIYPYYLDTPAGSYLDPPATAIVEPGNPIGGAFTLPTGFINVTGTYSLTPSSGWPGYTTITYVSYYNGPGKFAPNHGSTASNVRVVFPTTFGNPIPNNGRGDPVTPTTTFDGRYDFSRAQSINVTPGPRRFGGTFRLFYGPNAGFYQNIDLSTVFYKAYGHYICLDEGKFGCTPNTFASDIGDTTATFQITRFLLNVTGTGTGTGKSANTAKATTPRTPSGKAPTPYGNASFITGMQRYLHQIHPWTTGFASVKSQSQGVLVFTPQAQGYDISLGGADITVTHYDWNWNWNQTLNTFTTTTQSFKQYLKGVERVVSMVRPRLIHTYTVPLSTSADSTEYTGTKGRLWRLKVFFLPEPAGMLLLGAGIAVLLGLSRTRRR